jgi:hypothetical protein
MKLFRCRLLGYCCYSMFQCLQHVAHIGGHFINLGAVELFNVPQETDIFISHEVDCHTLPTKSPRPADPVDVQLPIGGQVVANDEGHLLYINPPAPQVRRNQDSRAARSEFLHHLVPLVLIHVPVHGAHGEVVLPHLVGQPIDLLSGIAEDYGLCDGQGVVQIAQRVKLPFLRFHSDEELLDPLQSQFIPLDQDLKGVIHELARHLQYRRGEGGTHQDDLACGGQEAVFGVCMMCVLGGGGCIFMCRQMEVNE